MRFRPCIDLHGGQVKQIVGGTFSDDEPERIATNFSTSRRPSWYAGRYRRDGLAGGHVIMLGKGNDEAALDALRAWPGGLQVGGGITSENALQWLQRGASHVIVTSHVFREGAVDEGRLRRLVDLVGRQRLVLDLSCRRRGGRYWVVTDRWQKFTDCEISPLNLDRLAASCDEFLVHAADVEGRRQGVEEGIVELLGRWEGIPVTYAGGIRNMEDLRLIAERGAGRLDFTVGSALDIFGGSLPYEDVVAFAREVG